MEFTAAVETLSGYLTPKNDIFLIAYLGTMKIISSNLTSVRQREGKLIIHNMKWNKNSIMYACIYLHKFAKCLFTLYMQKFQQILFFANVCFLRKFIQKKQV